MRRIAAWLVVMFAGIVSAGSAQSDPRLKAAVQLAAEGMSDSATAIVNGLLAVTPVTDTLYPEVLYTQGAISKTAAEMRRSFQKVAVEYPTSPWADDALLRLAQMDYAGRNYAGTVRGVEQIHANDPSSPLIPTADYWAARAEFEQGNAAAACGWITRGLSASSTDIEARNRLAFLQGRCTGGDSAAAAPAPAPATPGAWGVQVAAVSSQASANAVVAQLKEVGITGVVVPESGSLFKVRVTGLASREAADSAAAKIKAKLGGSPFVLVP